jgi:hypothetical protein
MKVNIGNYVSPINIEWVFDRYLEKMHKKDYWDINALDYTRLDKVVKWIIEQSQTVIDYTINKFYLNNKNRKIEVLIENHDLWSMDQTLSYIIHPMLIKLKESKNGIPMTDEADTPHIEKGKPVIEEVDSPHNLDYDLFGKGNENNFGHSDDKMAERWEWILDEMIYAFSTFDDKFLDQFHAGKIDYIFVKDETTGLSSMQKGPNDTHKFDHVGHDAAMIRRMNGLRLFAKYYESLWD